MIYNMFILSRALHELLVQSVTLTCLLRDLQALPLPKLIVTMSTSVDVGGVFMDTLELIITNHIQINNSLYAKTD